MSSSEQSQGPPATATQNLPAAANGSASQNLTNSNQGSATNIKAKTANPKQKQTPKPKVTDAAADGPSENLSPAELKKKAKAEKAARRAREKSERESAAGGSVGGTQNNPAQGGPVQTPRKAHPGGRDGPLSTPRGQKYAGGPRSAAAAPVEMKKKEDKNVAVFGHLYGIPRRSTIAGAAKEVHPAVLALGLQIRDYVICGSSARCVATLIAFKRVRSSLCLYCLLQSLIFTVVPRLSNPILHRVALLLPVT